MADPLGLVTNQAGGAAHPMTNIKGVAGPENGPGFKDVLMQNIADVNKLQQDAEMAISDLAAGRRDDVANVMTAKAKADLAFNMLLQVRNKLLDAYNEIKEMRV